MSKTDRQNEGFTDWRANTDDIANQLYKDFTEEQKAKLTEIQNTELKILSELDRICTKHNIQYFMNGGSLLGAMRHGDFIPWDDDIDIDLKRDDYYKIIKILPKELGDEFEFINYDEYGEYFCDFIPRIYYKNSRAVNSFSTDGGKTNFVNDDRMNRVFIELYCLMDSDTSVVAKQYFQIKVIYGLAMGHRYIPTPGYNYTPIQKAEVAVLSNIGKRMPLKKIYEMYEKCANQVPTGTGNRYFKPSVPLPVQNCNIFPKDIYDEQAEVNIRGNIIKVPGKIDEILSLLYSNWHELPGEKDRHPGHFNLLETEIF
ncbi:MAG: LicD family protein [Clostridiales bacterium]|nr:LicD family protein [Clostridiales bacterium]